MEERIEFENEQARKNAEQRRASEARARELNPKKIVRVSKRTNDGFATPSHVLCGPSSAAYHLKLEVLQKSSFARPTQSLGGG
jgi:hypothetical protein